MMDVLFTKELEDALKAGYIDGTTIAKPEYMPKLLINDAKKQTKVLTTLLSELQSCDEFAFSVAFITNGGVEVIIDTLRQLSARGIRGKILASSYQNFTQPNALRRLIQFDNIDVKIQTENNFHAKGYLFKHGQGHTLIIGSSNLTQDALCRNSEWNLKVSSFVQGSIVSDIREEFDRQFESATVVDEEWIIQYERIYQYQRIANISNANVIKERTKQDGLTGYRPSPNAMQKEALLSLEALRAEKRNKALLISATGTGKTYLSAFDASAFNAKKLLFIVHRENIAKAAMNTFKSVFGDTRSMGLYCGSMHESDCDFIFSTVQTMSREEHLTKFKSNEFDYIVIDEVHRSGAKTYQRILDYFKPQFLLGMSATPERTDGIDIFKTFDYNIAYEIRLQEALEQDMLAPFHYHGITDIIINGKPVDENTKFNQLVSNNRINHIFEETRFYGCDHGRIKGLIFCSRKEEATELSKKLNKKGLKTKALTGNDSEEKREAAIQLLESDDPEKYLDYIITVDIFNEGVDIPSVNQVVMLRPTQSAIIFVQQLGRGLRKANGKEYVVVIDFIGNYKESFLIPMSLSGDKSYNKDNVRKFLSEGSRVVPGCSTIEFDEIAKERIYSSIDTARFNDIKIIKDSYLNLRARLGRVPSLMDFDKYGSVDPLRIFDNQNLGSYHTFLLKHEKSYNTKYTKAQENVLKFVSKKIASGKRIHELIILKLLMEDDNNVIYRFSKVMKNKYHTIVTDKIKTNVVNFMTNEFFTGSSKNSYKYAVFLKLDGSDYSISDEYKAMLLDDSFKAEVQELIDFGFSRNERFYSARYENTFLTLNAKYTYEDVCRLLNWEKGEVALNIGGYKYDKKSSTYPVFINYDKSTEQGETIDYKDRFLSPSHLIALSKKHRTVNSDDVQIAINAKQSGVDMELFVRKNKEDNESKEFYYLGKIFATGETNSVMVEGEDAVEINYMLKNPVQESLYEYLTS